ncbi:MAG: hypothetical protein P4N59_31430 [Negativicutes bacterium]|nr:hypothetical protein [Negativicutes bacterium]
MEKRKKRGFRKLKLCACLDDKYPVTICTLPDGTKNQPIAQDKELDIAVFDLEPYKAYIGEHKKLAILNAEPKIQIKEKDWVGIVGHPGRFRVEVKNGVQYGREPYCGYISSVSGCKFQVDFTRIMDFDRNLLIKKWSRKKLPTRGISGSPCFIVQPNHKLSLVGFVTEHHGWKSIPNNFVQVTMSDCINEDGTLKPADSFHHHQ